MFRGLAITTALLATLVSFSNHAKANYDTTVAGTYICKIYADLQEQEGSVRGKVMRAMGFNGRLANRHRLISVRREYVGYGQLHCQDRNLVDTDKVIVKNVTLRLVKIGPNIQLGHRSSMRVAFPAFGLADLEQLNVMRSVGLVVDLSLLGGTVEAGAGVNIDSDDYGISGLSANLVGGVGHTDSSLGQHTRLGTAGIGATVVWRLEVAEYYPQQQYPQQQY